VNGPALARDAALALADVLSYPDAALPSRARAAAAALPPDAGEPLRRLADHLAAIGSAAAEELYTSTFDLRPAVSPYLGHHLCGEGPRRNALLAWLATEYARAGLRGPREVPDHFAEVLRWLAAAGESPEAREVASLALLPAAEKARATLDEGHPYRAAFEALLALAPRSAPEHASEAREEVAP
jgi:nitrate reductase delta subunit